MKTPVTVTPVGGSGTNITVGLTMDYSGSMSSSDVSNMETAAVNFINLMSTGDAMEIVKFATTVEVVQSFTTEKQRLIDAVRRSWSGKGGSTALYDAVYLSLTNTPPLFFQLIEAVNRALLPLCPYLSRVGLSFPCVRLESNINNGVLKGINNLIQDAKAMARGYRTIINLKAMIYMICGNMNFYLPYLTHAKW